MACSETFSLMVFTLEIKQEETLVYISGSGTYWVVGPTSSN